MSWTSPPIALARPNAWVVVGGGAVLGLLLSVPFGLFGREPSSAPLSIRVCSEPNAPSTLHLDACGTMPLMHWPLAALNKERAFINLDACLSGKECALDTPAADWGFVYRTPPPGAAHLSWDAARLRRDSEALTNTLARSLLAIELVWRTARLAKERPLFQLSRLPSASGPVLVGTCQSLLLGSVRASSGTSAVISECSTPELSFQPSRQIAALQAAGFKWTVNPPIEDTTSDLRWSLFPYMSTEETEETEEERVQFSRPPDNPTVAGPSRTLVDLTIPGVSWMPLENPVFVVLGISAVAVLLVGARLELRTLRNRPAHDMHEGQSSDTGTADEDADDMGGSYSTKRSRKPGGRAPDSVPVIARPNTGKPSPRDSTVPEPQQALPLISPPLTPEQRVEQLEAQQRSFQTAIKEEVENLKSEIAPFVTDDDLPNGRPSPSVSLALRRLFTQEINEALQRHKLDMEFTSAPLSRDLATLNRTLAQVCEDVGTLRTRTQSNADAFTAVEGRLAIIAEDLKRTLHGEFEDSVRQIVFGGEQSQQSGAIAKGTPPPAIHDDARKPLLAMLKFTDLPSALHRHLRTRLHRLRSSRGPAPLILRPFLDAVTMDVNEAAVRDTFRSEVERAVESLYHLEGDRAHLQWWLGQRTDWFPARNWAPPASALAVENLIRDHWAPHRLPWVQFLIEALPQELPSCDILASALDDFEQESGRRGSDVFHEYAREIYVSLGAMYNPIEIYSHDIHSDTIQRLINSVSSPESSVRRHAFSTQLFSRGLVREHGVIVRVKRPIVRFRNRSASGGDYDWEGTVEFADKP